MIQASEKIYSFEDYAQYNDQLDHRYELVDGKLVLMNTPTVSDDSVTRDYRYKRSEYAALGVDEYWIVDPKNEQITILLLEEGLYEETVYQLSDTLVSRLFSDLDLTVNQVLVSGNL